MKDQSGKQLYLNAVVNGCNCKMLYKVQVIYLLKYAMEHTKHQNTIYLYLITTYIKHILKENFMFFLCYLDMKNEFIEFSYKFIQNL